jgi:peptidyl-prolyl cis-trans isomerase SurA
MCGLILSLGLSVGTVSEARAQGFNNFQEGTVLDEIVAIVDDQLILRSDLQMMMAQVARGQEVPPAMRGQLESRILQQLINQEVMLVHAKRDTNITVSSERVDQMLDQQINRLARQVGGESQLEQQYGKSVVQIRNDYRSQVRDQLLSQRLYQTKQREIQITPSEVREWFERIPQDSLPTIPKTVRVAHVVRYPDTRPEASQEAREVISSIRDSILTGADFEEMARRHSEDQGSASDGGRFENFNLNDLVPEMGAVASQLEPGEVSQVFETQFGFHIMRLNQKRGDIIDFNHILIRIDESRTDAEGAIEYLRTLRDSVVNENVPFERLARRHSEDEQSAQRGGYVSDPNSGNRDLPLEQLGSSWQSTLDTMEVGEISQPAQVELRNGEQAWHIVWLQKRTPAHQANLQDDYGRIRRLALNEKQQREMQKWLRQLRKDVYISIKDESLAAQTPRVQ